MKLSKILSKRVLSLLIVGLFVFTAFAVIQSGGGQEQASPSAVNSFTFPYQYGTPTVPSDVGAQGIQGLTVPQSQIGVHGSIGARLGNWIPHSQWYEKIIANPVSLDMQVLYGVISDSSSAAGSIVTLTNLTTGNNVTMSVPTDSYTNFSITAGWYVLQIKSASDTYMNFTQYLDIKSSETITRYLMPVSYSHITVDNGPASVDERYIFYPISQTFSPLTLTEIQVNLYNSTSPLTLLATGYTNDYSNAADNQGIEGVNFSGLNVNYNYYVSVQGYNNPLTGVITQYENYSFNGGGSITGNISIKVAAPDAVNSNINYFTGTVSGTSFPSPQNSNVTSFAKYQLTENTTLSNGYGVLSFPVSTSLSSVRFTVQNSTVMFLYNNLIYGYPYGFGAGVSFDFINSTVILNGLSAAFSTNGVSPNSPITLLNSIFVMSSQNFTSDKPYYNFSHVANSLIEFGSVPYSQPGNDYAYWNLQNVNNSIFYDDHSIETTGQTVALNYVSFVNVTFANNYPVEASNSYLNDSVFLNSSLSLDTLNFFAFNSNMTLTGFGTTGIGSETIVIGNTSNPGFFGEKGKGEITQSILSVVPASNLSWYFPRYNWTNNAYGFTVYVPASTNISYSYINDSNPGLLYTISSRYLTVWNDIIDANETQSDYSYYAGAVISHGVLNWTYLHHVYAQPEVVLFGSRSVNASNFIEDGAQFQFFFPNATIQHGIFQYGFWGVTQMYFSMWGVFQGGLYRGNTVNISNNTFRYIGYNYNISSELNMIGYFPLSVELINPLNTPQPVPHMYLNIRHNTFMPYQVGVGGGSAPGLLQIYEGNVTYNITYNVFYNSQQYVIGPHNIYGQYNIGQESGDIGVSAGFPYIAHNWFLNLSNETLPITGNGWIGTQEVLNEPMGLQGKMTLVDNHFYFHPFPLYQLDAPNGLGYNSKQLGPMTPTMISSLYTNISYEIPEQYNISSPTISDQNQYIYNTTMLQKSVGVNTNLVNAYSWAIAPDVNTLSGTPIISYSNGLVGGPQPSFTWKGYNYSESVEPTYIQVGVNSSKAPSVDLQFSGVPGTKYLVQAFSQGSEFESFVENASSSGILNATYNPATMPLDPTFEVSPYVAPLPPYNPVQPNPPMNFFPAYVFYILLAASAAGVAAGIYIMIRRR